HLPERAAETALRLLVLELPDHPGRPADPAVRARHVHDRRARLGRGEDIGLRDHVGDLVAAPAVALHTDRLLVDEAAPDQLGDAGDDRVQRALARVPDPVDYVRDEDEVAPAHVEAEADAR